MRRLVNVTLAIAGVMSLTLLASSSISAQKLPKSITIQAQAMGQSTQLGRTFGITLIINEYSTPEDQKALIGAFYEKKNEGLVNAVSKMHSKGRLAITGTLGYDVNYIRKFTMPDGSTKIRLVTDRPIAFGEVWSGSRSMDYNLSAMEIVLTPNNKNNSGTLLPACEFTLDKENHLELELRMNAWKLVNVRRR